MNNGTCGNPKGPSASVPAFGETVYPDLLRGVRKMAEPGSPVVCAGGGYLLDSHNGDNDTHGLNWTFDADSVPGVRAGRIQSGTRSRPTGLPGTFVGDLQ